MRFTFKPAATLAAIFALATSLSAEAPSHDASSAVRKAEARGLSTVPTSRFTGLLTAPEGVTEVSFSRSWLDTQPTPSGNANWACLTEALYFEARGETLKGQFAVAEVIMNRVKSSRFPDNICAVINQGTGRKYQCQFTYTCDGNPDTIREKGAYRNVGKVARAVMDGRAPALTSGATHYHTTAVRPKWSRVYSKTAAIGVHVFYRHTYRTATN
ncbi:cell wall hydrolase [uncultured Tateyamaria sp.]|uniref:cell wall hydrolase n=1 Tax=uncultured Tateyamaria sp. TaxID=455651 RepID=UPI00261533FF|nr:cell wall hydrolase [uncultured Tateyamaria sp.]